MANHATIKNTKVNVGDTVRIFYRIIEKETQAGKTKREVKETVRERFQPFEGTIIGIKGEGDNQSFTIRRIGVGAIGIERIIPLVSPWVSKVVVTKKGFVRRAKLNYIRDAKSKNKIKTEKVAEEIVSKKELKESAKESTQEKPGEAKVNEPEKKAEEVKKPEVKEEPKKEAKTEVKKTEDNTKEEKKA